MYSNWFHPYQRKEEEVKRKEEEVKRKEEEAKRKEEEVKRIEEELKREKYFKIADTALTSSFPNMLMDRNEHGFLEESPMAAMRSSANEGYYLSPNVEKAWNAAIPDGSGARPRPIKGCHGTASTTSELRSAAPVMGGIPAVTRPKAPSQLTQAPPGFRLATRSPVSVWSSNAQLAQATSGPPAPPEYQLAVTRPSVSVWSSHAQLAQATSGPPAPPEYQLAVTRPSVLNSNAIISRAQLAPAASGGQLAIMRPRPAAPFPDAEHQSYTIELVNVAPGIQIPKKKLISRYLPSPVKEAQKGIPILGRGNKFDNINPEPDHAANNAAAGARALPPAQGNSALNGDATGDFTPYRIF